FYVSWLKALYGDAATPENEFGYPWTPKIEDGKAYSMLHLFDRIYEGKIKGLFAYGTDPAVSTPNTNKTRKALEKLDFLVCANIFDNETSAFWYGPGLDPKKVKTEVFLLPASATMEKEGSQSNSGRWVQWKYKAAPAPGDAISCGDIQIRFLDALKALYAREGGPNAESILNLKWDYKDLEGNMDVERIAKQINGHWTSDVEINGKQYKKGDLVPTFGLLKSDGTTSCGNWIMSGSFGADGENKMKRRGKEDPTGLGLYPNWSFAWPVNRRIIYNRASCDVNGKPYNPKRKLLEWTGSKWVGDVPDGPWPPMADKEKGKYPFIMKADGVGSIFGPAMAEGPFPEHYEPLESPLKKNPMSDQLINPAIEIFDCELDKVANASDEFPYVCTTYSCTEHWCSGALTRWQAWLLEMQPEAYVEIGEALAKEKGIRNGQKVKVSSIRGHVTCVAMVTKRFVPFTVEGNTVHQVGMPFNYGWLYPEDGGDSANFLTTTVGDANVFCPEFKAFMVNVTAI
ncbi:MAG TPA: molybdopterin dinucleotide binding domain-containing protein, partial [Deltaproteobacteria bacterium]|nr:molybdopterin dinucleotide binding domain-containing protein [Deltaproteobacteria bacterium]